MESRECSVRRTWALAMARWLVSSPAGVLLPQSCGQVGQPLGCPHIPDSNRQGTGLPDHHNQLLASGDTVVYL